MAQANLDQGAQAAAGQRQGHGGQDDHGDQEHHDLWVRTIGRD
jgi:hypothetical protein